jgi:hypothetical protein
MKKSIFFLFLYFITQTSIIAQTGKLYQAGYNGNNYEFGFHSSPTLSIIGAPEDTDWERWSILHDGSVYRLYFMPIGRSNVLYQFGYNPNTGNYEYGYESKPVIEITGLPKNTNVTNFSILYDGSYYRLYFKSSDNFSLYQCGYNFYQEKYEYGYESIPEIQITNAPSDVDLRSWSMLFDGETYRLYFTSKTNKNKLYQFGFDGFSYDFGYNSSPTLKIVGMPIRNYVKKFNITHDGLDYRFYNLEKIN